MEVIELLQVLDNVLDVFDNKSNIKYHLLKEQIENKISIIKHFIYYGFPVLNYTNQEQLDILYYLKFAGKIADIDNMINDIIKNIYESSGYQVLLKNIPTKAKLQTTVDNSSTSNLDTIEDVNAERMYDTLEIYVGEDNIESVFQVSSDTYLAKFQLDSEAKRIVNLIDNKMIENNFILVQYMAQIENFKDSIYMDESMIYVESDCEKYEKEFKDIEFKDIELLNLLDCENTQNIDNIDTYPEPKNDYTYIGTPESIYTSLLEQIPIPIIDLNKPIKYNIDDIDEDNSFLEKPRQSSFLEKAHQSSFLEKPHQSSFLEKPRQNIDINKGFKGASAPLAEAPLADDGWQVYEKKSLIGVLFNNIVGSISNKFYTISRYFSNK